MTILYLKCRYCCCFLLAFFCLQRACAQTSFTGKVINEKDDAAIQNASVYFNNTTIATQTNQQGEFKFEAIPFLNTELVIFSPGYELIVFKPTTAQLSVKRFVFKLHAKELPELPKQNLNPELKKNYLNAFYQGFLGITEEAAHCEVSNGKDIYFTGDKTNGGFSAFADTALVIINNLLGYKIYYNLVQFFYDGFNGRSYFTGYCRYEELGDEKQFRQTRSHCYFGSSQHFYRSLVAHRLNEQGFGVFINSPAKAPAGKNSKKNEGDDNFTPLTEQQILWIDSSNNFSIGIKGKLVIQYNKNPHSKSYLSKILLYLEGDLKKGIEANIDIKNAPLELTTIGVPVDDTNIEYGGYWSYEKLANTLPFDYQPELR